MRRLLIGALFALLALPALAIGVDEPLPDPALEARAREIAKGLRCLVCQNQSIEDSNAPLAADLRRIVRERVSAGDDEAAVQAYLVERYGEWVLLRPPFEPATWALWLGPFVILAAGAGLILLRRRRPAAAEPAAPLSAEERARLDALLLRDEDAP
ncbi:cytochrome c-type biogenesis protein [Zavarzinia compransoris]|uniref:Cytochrome c-type biogenesis protein n=1 Tax=Zavarzinia compransoris TaxID=1264899 RepID=A0A317E9S4_9PROT|nr:cytochrome c-type biogenesis protein [Zavarzinia compransoris]PWR22073.1 cytochrome C biogenesis protein CcmH [Zavarzinia compransoris]TDP47185.1 cytochrome c-type biogenesis protein CcmH [Zavarzinia compransoris]